MTVAPFVLSFKACSISHQSHLEQERRYERQQQQQTASGAGTRARSEVGGRVGNDSSSAIVLPFRSAARQLFEARRDDNHTAEPSFEEEHQQRDHKQQQRYNKHHIQWSQLQQRQQTSGIIMHSIGINDNHIESTEAAARSRVISNNNDCGGGAESSRMHKLQQQNNSSASVRQLTGCGMNDIGIDERDSDTEHENDKENVNKSTGTGSSTINRKAVAGAVNSSSSRGNISRYALILHTYISIPRSERQRPIIIVKLFMSSIFKVLKETEDKKYDVMF
jgi:hypothetical protein